MDASVLVLYQSLLWFAAPDNSKLHLTYWKSGKQLKASTYGRIAADMWNRDGVEQATEKQVLYAAAIAYAMRLVLLRSDL